MQGAEKLKFSIDVDTGRRPCPGCEKDNGTTVGSKNGFDLLVCQYCRTVYTSHLPPPQEAKDYDDYYSEANLTAPSFVNVRIKEIVGEFTSFRQTNRFLDIGFGAGTILLNAREQGWEPYGIEVSKPAVEQDKRLGFEVFHGELAAAEYPDNFFDVVTASEIIEHLPDPTSVRREVARILRPGGLFWATTPSATCLSFRSIGVNWSVVAPPEHTQLFSRKAVARKLKDAGFAHVQIRTHGFNPLEVINYFRSGGNEDLVFDRVESSYQLNESLTKSPVRKFVKHALNRSLDLFHVGDLLKIRAQAK